MFEVGGGWMFVFVVERSYFYLSFSLTYKTIILPGFLGVPGVCPLSRGKFLWGSKRKKKKRIKHS